MEPFYFCDNFNRKQFFTLSLVFMYIALLSLRLNGFIMWPYWVVFFPLWLWQSVMFGGFLFEIFAFCRSPRYYVETQAQFKQTFFDAFFHINLLFFGVLACNQMERIQHSWISVFAPLIILSVSGICVSFWALRNDFDCDLQLLVSANTVFFTFVSLKLDELISWSWKVIFIPNWVGLGFFFILDFTEIVISIGRLTWPRMLPNYRKQSFFTSLGYAISMLLISSSGVLLALHFDGDFGLPFVIITAPLMSALTVFMSLCFSTHSHFQWRRGLQFILRYGVQACHPWQEYSNISYKLSSLCASTCNQPSGTEDSSSQQTPPQSSRQFEEVRVNTITTTPPSAVCARKARHGRTLAKQDSDSVSSILLSRVAQKQAPPAEPFDCRLLMQRLDAPD